MKIIDDIKKLQATSIKNVIDERLKGFSAIKNKGNEEWFLELCFCLLTANTSAELGLRVQKELGYTGFTNFKNEEELALRLKNAKYRFYNRRAHFIALTCIYKNNIKDILLKCDNNRDWLVKNIKGIGYKEASHFLRNIGYFNYAILDKHILRLMKDNNLIDNIPKSLSENNYLKYENILGEICKKINIPQGEMDLYLWYMKTGKILK